MASSLREFGVALCVVAISACQKTTSLRTQDAAVPSVADALPDVSVAPNVEIRDAGANDPKEASVPLRADGGAACTRLFGPEEQPFHGPATPLVRNGELLLVTNELGKPRVDRRPIVAPGKDPASKGPERIRSVRWPACEIAGDLAYCVADGSILQRTPLAGGVTREIAHTRPGTRIAASALGELHTSVFYLSERRTTEGVLNEAYVAVDDREPQRVSEEGSGATQVLAAPIGNAALVLMLDARLSMTPVHARTVTLSGDRVALGKDAVVFVGGSPEIGVSMAVAQSKETAFALVPLPMETVRFGMAIVPLPLPARDDMPFVWSQYPNGLDPAPLAATLGADRPTVVSLRPESVEPGSKRVLELGTLDENGAYSARSAIHPAGKVAEIRVARDAFGADWILYGDSSKTWLERRLCK